MITSIYRSDLKLWLIINQHPNIDIVYSEQQVKHFDHNLNLTHEGVRQAPGILNQPVCIVDHCSVMHTRRIANLVVEMFREVTGTTILVIGLLVMQLFGYV